MHGVTLDRVLNHLIDTYGWDLLAKKIKINCFISNPRVKSSLNFLRKTPWARNEVEKLYLESLENKY
tara:strand:+ start:990 stop:1190 length:201 start_codon:yes stop_codon:yes gene_type:complete